MPHRAFKANLRSKVQLGFATALICLAAIGFISQHSLKRSIEDTVWVVRTTEVLGQLTDLGEALLSAENSERGFLLTGEQRRLDKFHEAQGEALAHLAQLQHLTVDSPTQQKRLAHLEELIQQVLRNRQASSITPEALASPARVPGRDVLSDTQLLEEVRAAFQQVRADERRLLHQRSQESTHSSGKAQETVAAGSILAGVVVLLCFVFVERSLRRRVQAEATLLAMQKELEHRVAQRTSELSTLTRSLQAEIADRNAIEERLRENEHRYRMLFEDSPVPMVVFDVKTFQYLAVNAAAEQLYGYSREEFLTLTLGDVRAPEQLPGLFEFLKKIESEDAYRGTFTCRRKDGQVLTIESSGRKIQFGDRPARLALITDITEQKHLEAQLQQAQKMEAVGRLAGGIAHDFNNLLTVILGYSDALLRKMEHNHPLRSKLAEIQGAGQRAANLTNQLLAFSRKQVLQVQTLELNTVVSNMGRMLRRLLGEDIQISLHLDAALGQIQADPTQLEQVLLNLAVNARDAMPHGGKLVIETYNAELTNKSALLHGIPWGHYAVLVVSDTGCGMDEATKAHVFEPFFTTKEVGKGTGLGLSMVLGVVQQSGGTVTVYSEPGVGTTFKIYLPVAESPAAPLEREEELPMVYAAQGTIILLVEDEDRVRSLAREVLEDAGYMVVEATNGRTALEAAEGLLEAPAVVMTDVIMPEISGPQLATQLSKKWPDMPILYTSGYTDHALLARSSLQRDSHFLQKPYTPGTLLKQIASVLERR